MIEYAPHAITMTLYVAVMLLAVRNIFAVNRAHQHAILRLAIRAYIGMTVYASGLFIFNQTNWVLNSHGDLVGTWADMLWIHGDHAVALTWLFGQALLRVYLNFRSGSDEHPRRRSDDP